MVKKVYLDMVGCRLNQSELEIYASQLRSAGYTIVESAGEADLVVVNTCDVTAEAASDSRQKIRQAARLGVEQIVVTGCWSTLNPEGAQALPGVSRVVPNALKDSLVPDLLAIPPEEFDLEPVARQPLPGIHRRTRAFIKAQDGCDNHCTFCITRLARGAGRSRPADEVCQDVRRAIVGGTKEIVLTGVHLASWGQDLEPVRPLRALVEAVLAVPGLERLRFSSLEPWDLDEAFFGLWQDRRVCRHLHLPLQSGSEKTVRRMARKTLPEAYADLVALARQMIPEVALTTDIIVGFPGEGPAEVEESLNFIRRMDFAAGHVFTYSPRPGTPAARFPDPVPHLEAKMRSTQVRAVLAESAQKYRQQFIGRVLAVLWEATDVYGPEGWRLEGLTDNYLRVSAYSPDHLWNQVSPVALMSLEPDGISGAII
jgi:threonylcarbamoyladenosine tRNA methylthiotransferase MtaB